MPDRRPVLWLKLAQDGRPVIEKARVSPSASVAVGWNEYAWPTVAEVEGVPLIAGARFAASTRMLNAGSELTAMPSLTEI